MQNKIFERVRNVKYPVRKGFSPRIMALGGRLMKKTAGKKPRDTAPLSFRKILEVESLENYLQCPDSWHTTF
jgi:hypothetical protein